MFVGKVDRDNTIHLVKMRMKENFFAKKLGIFLTILFGINLIVLLYNIIIYSDKVTSISSNVFSMWGFNISLIVCGNILLNFKDYYNKHQIYPQNKFSRFTSQETYCYINFFIVQVYCLFLYLLEMAIVSSIKIFKTNIELAYHFNLQYIFAGFFVSVMYGFLLISIFILYTTLLRKYRIPFAVLTVIIAIFILRSRYLSLVIKVLNFYINEHSILLFLMKALCTWFIIIAFSHLINKYTKYYDIEKPKFKKSFSTVIIAIFIFVFLISFSYFPFTINRSSSVGYGTSEAKKITEIIGTELNSEEINSEEINSNWDKYTNYKIEKVIDVSNIPDGSNLTVQIPTELLDNGNLMNTSISYGEELTNPSDDKIEIEYMPTSETINFVNLNYFTKIDLNAQLEDNKIILREDYRKNIKVVMISPYSLMTQFDYFKGKQILKEYIGFTEGTSYASIIIYQPKGKKLNFNIDYTNDK